MRPYEMKLFRLCQHRTPKPHHTSTLIGEVAYRVIKLPVFVCAALLSRHKRI